MSTRTTVLLIITGTQEPTLVVRDILAGRSPGVARKVELVTAPTLAAVLDSRVVEVPAPLETPVDRHVGAVVEDLVVEETAGRGLRDTGVVREVLIAWVDDGAGGGWLGGCRGAG